MIINCKEIREKEIAKIKETYKGGCKVVFTKGKKDGNNKWIADNIERIGSV